ncbi:TipAS antibiotic-recognition domain-containing protein [Laceyella putida]|uniref:TipAS antibiotic-recognition domain-containing protein n=1 Tax=Laceyella putida TaxID=110101 RepID=A0ABW2RJD4_9BACL
MDRGDLHECEQFYEWNALIGKVRAELEKGTPPESPVVLRLAKRWKELIDMFSAGDPEITKAAERFHAENPNNPLQRSGRGAL